MITVERGRNGCDIATIRDPPASKLVWRVVANVIGERDSRSVYIKNECLKYDRFVLFGQFDIHKVFFGIKW